MALKIPLHMYNFWFFFYIDELIDFLLEIFDPIKSYIVEDLVIEYSLN